MKTYLVTGGAGFIGSNFIQYLLETKQNSRVINVDALTYAGSLTNLRLIENDARYCFVKANICNKEALNRIFEKESIDIIVHFAAESHVDRSIINPEVFAETNIIGTVNLLNVAKEHWATDCDSFAQGKKFVQISTDEVYGSLGATGYFTEKTPLNPHSPYSSSKASADLIVQSYYDTYKLPINITRCSNNYGPYQFPEKLIPLVITNCLVRKPIPVYGDGLNIRDWLYVEDHCRAIDLVIEKGKLGEVYNIGGNNEKTNLELVKEIIKQIPLEDVNEKLITFVEDRKGHDRRYAIDSTKIKQQLGWEPETPFDEGLRRTIQWYISRTVK